MENARKGVTPSYSEMGRHRYSPKKTIATSPASKPTRLIGVSETEKHLPATSSLRVANDDSQPSRFADVNSVTQIRSSTINKKMEELSVTAREVFDRMERLTKMRQASPMRDPESSKKTGTVSKRLPATSPVSVHKSETLVSPPASAHLFSILKRPTEETSVPVAPHVEHAVSVLAPVSILKRTVFQDDFRSQGGTSSTEVTFSPSVVDTTPTRKKQGILKKRRSLDESQVLR